MLSHPGKTSYCFAFSLGGGSRSGHGNPSNSQNVTAAPANKEPIENNKKGSQVGLIAIILLVAVVLVAVIAVVVFVLCYRKRIKKKFPDNLKDQKETARLQEMEIIAATSTLIPSEPNTPNQTDGTQRTFTYPLPRRRLSSSGSVNSTTPLLKYRNGSYRSRFSSGVSSRIDSNIAEGKDREPLLTTCAREIQWGFSSTKLLFKNTLFPTETVAPRIHKRCFACTGQAV